MFLLSGYFFLLWQIYKVYAAVYVLMAVYGFTKVGLGMTFKIFRVVWRGMWKGVGGIGGLVMGKGWNKCRGSESINFMFEESETIDGWTVIDDSWEASEDEDWKQSVRGYQMTKREIEMIERVRIDNK